ncbi:MAG: hypothetical protein JNK47_16485 [Mesorhizobium sp.]|nr:glycosyltransferase [Mesorhizobium sp.]MBL8578821.1 hypothetical protein [Mesorhizobium sp.]
MKTALVLACDDNFIPYTSVVARRIAYYAREKFPIIVVSDCVTDENKRLAQKFCPQISFIEAGHLFENRTFRMTTAVTRATCLRLFLDEILADFDRAVSLDSDLSPMTDISPLLYMVPKVAPVIAGYDLLELPTLVNNDRVGMSPDKAYFNSGVMVYDLQAIRHEKILSSALQFALNNPDRCKYVDQDAQNAILDGRWQVMDWRWNTLNYSSDSLPKQPFIRHFAGNNKPWSQNKVGIQPTFINQWRSDLQDSPWTGCFHEETIKRRIRNSLRPIAVKIESRIKSQIYNGSRGRRGQRMRDADHFLDLLSFIEKAASQGSLALPLVSFDAGKENARQIHSQ